MGTHLRELSESFPMNTNITGFIWFSKNLLHPCAFNESSLSIGKGYRQLIMFIFSVSALDFPKKQWAMQEDLSYFVHLVGPI